MERPQKERAGVEVASTGPINATLTTFDTAGQPIAVDGPVLIGSGPMTIRTAMGVSAPQPTIVRATLQFVNAFAEVIDQLEFDSAGVAELDTEAPSVALVATA